MPWSLLIDDKQDGHFQCITCHNTARGKNKPKHGDGLRSTGIGHIYCGCPEDAALLEFFIFKLGGTCYNSPSRPLPGQDKQSLEFPHSDFNLNPVHMALFGNVLDQLGMDADQLFIQREMRLLRIIRASCNELQTAFKVIDDADPAGKYEGEYELVKQFFTVTSDFCEDMRRLHKQTPLPNGSYDINNKNVSV